MQTFPGMQRNRTRQNPLILAVYAFVFLFYEALAMRYLFLPPLFGVLFFLMIRALDHNRGGMYLYVAFLLMVVETAKGYPALSSVLFYTLSYFTVVPRIRNAVSCPACHNALIVVYAYLGYWAFSALVSQMFAVSGPQFDWRAIFYIAIEFFTVGLL